MQLPADAPTAFNINEIRVPPRHFSCELLTPAIWQAIQFSREGVPFPDSAALQKKIGGMGPGRIQDLLLAGMHFTDAATVQATKDDKARKNRRHTRARDGWHSLVQTAASPKTYRAQTTDRMTSNIVLMEVADGRWTLTIDTETVTAPPNKISDGVPVDSTWTHVVKPESTHAIQVSFEGANCLLGHANFCVVVVRPVTSPSRTRSAPPHNLRRRGQRRPSPRRRKTGRPHPRHHVRGEARKYTRATRRCRVTRALNVFARYPAQTGRTGNCGVRRAGLRTCCDTRQCRK